MLVSLGILLVPPLFAPSLPVMCVLMVIAGIPIAPAFASSYGLVDRLAVPETTTEAFSWLSTAIVTGVSLGDGRRRRRDREPRADVVARARAPVALAAGLVVLALRRTLASGPAQPVA